jgi:4-hydroxybenzoate polyprenyltransferase
MKSLLHTLQKGIASLEAMPTSYALWLTSFTSLIFARIMVENWLNGFESRSLQFIFYEFTHTFFFFLLSFLILWPLVTFFTKTSLLKVSSVLLFGFLIILTPPIVDVWISNGAHLWSFYKFDGLIGLWHRYLTLFGDRPDIGITYGVRIEVVITTLFIALYTYIKTKKLLRSLLAAIATYSTLFILGTFPSWLTLIITSFDKNIFSINDIDIAALFLSPPTLFSQSNFEFLSGLNIKMSLIYAPLTLTIFTFYLWRYFPKKFFALIHNARFPQIIYHGGLFFVGIGMARALTNTPFPLLDIFTVIGLADLVIAIGCAWLASVIVNDLFDQNIDMLTNPTRPLEKHIFSQEEYKAIGITFFAASLLFAAIVSFKSMLLLLIYQALAWLYSAQPLRLKRFPFIATGVTAIASLLILIVGFTLIVPESNIAKLPTSFLSFFAFVFIVSLPLKDFKDIAGDKADKVYTIPVIFGEQWGKIIIGSGIFLSYMISVIIFHELRLFWWALLGGSLSFWILTISQVNEKKLLSYRKLPGLVLGLITLYGLVLIKILFY